MAAKPIKNRSVSKAKTWKNVDNARFYDSIPLDLLPNFAIKGGLDTGCDLDLIMPYVKKAKSILELGSGYGRIISLLIDKKYAGKLTAIERSQRFCKLLKTKFGDRVSVIESDIKNLKIKESFNLILWLWSGICDFSKNEQLPALKKIIMHLSNNGALVLDSLLPTNRPVNASSESNDQNYVIPGGNNSNLYVYTPSPEEIDQYAKKIGLAFVKHMPYKTSTGRDRMLYIFRNSKT